MHNTNRTNTRSTSFLHMKVTDIHPITIKGSLFPLIRIWPSYLMVEPSLQVHLNVLTTLYSVFLAVLFWVYDPLSAENCVCYVVSGGVREYSVHV